MCGSTAVALNTCNGNLMMDYPAIDEINKITFVITVNFKVSLSVMSLASLVHIASIISQKKVSVKTYYNYFPKS